MDWMRMTHMGGARNRRQFCAENGACAPPAARSTQNRSSARRCRAPGNVCAHELDSLPPAPPCSHNAPRELARPGAEAPIDLAGDGGGRVSSVRSDVDSSRVDALEPPAPLPAARSSAIGNKMTDANGRRPPPGPSSRSSSFGAPPWAVGGRARASGWPAPDDSIARAPKLIPTGDEGR
jgi:hypothetical protein